MSPKIRKLTDYMADIRQHEDQWFKENPHAHPVEMYKDIAKAIVSQIIIDNIDTVLVQIPIYNGGIPEYTYTIAYLHEASINISTIGAREYHE